MVWEQKDGAGNWQIYKAELHGGSWTTPLSLADHLSVGGTNAHGPQVALNASGDAVVVWYQSDGSTDQIYKAERHSGGWSVPISLADHLSVGGSDARTARVALNDDGETVVVWRQQDGSNWQVYKAERHGGEMDPTHEPFRPPKHGR